MYKFSFTSEATLCHAISKQQQQQQQQLDGLVVAQFSMKGRPQQQGQTE